MENVAIELAEIYGYQEVRTPIFEPAELFAQGMGPDSTFIERDLWLVNDKQGRRLAMRGNLLLPVIRALNDQQILNVKNTEPQKFYYLGPVFSCLKGRESVPLESHRFGVVALGSTLPSLDVEVLMVAYDFFTALGLSDLKVQLNSLGCKKCRAEYERVLYDYFSRRSEELCPQCQRRHRTHPMWTMGCPEERCRQLAQVAPSIFGYLCPDCRDNFEAVRSYLHELKVPYRLSPLLVPDVEDYNRTVFQISWGEHLLSAGGRCDSLSHMLGGADVPGVNCGVDLDLTLDAIREANLVPEQQREIDVCLAGSSQAAVALLLPVLYALRRAGIYAELAYPRSDDSDARQAASNSQAHFVIYLDEASLRQRIVRFREYAGFHDMRLNDALHRIGRCFGIENLEDELRPVEVRKFSISRRQPASMRQSYELFEPTRQPPKATAAVADVLVKESESNGNRRRRRRRGEVDQPEEQAEVVLLEEAEEPEVEVTEVEAQPTEVESKVEEEMEPRKRRRRQARNGENASERVYSQACAIASAVGGVLGAPQGEEEEEEPLPIFIEVETSPESEEEPPAARRGSRLRPLRESSAKKSSPRAAESAAEEGYEALEESGRTERGGRRARSRQSESSPATRRRRQRRNEDSLECEGVAENEYSPERAEMAIGYSSPQLEEARALEETRAARVTLEAREVDAIAEINASQYALNDEEIEASLALPKLEEQEYQEISAPDLTPSYRRRFHNGSCQRELDSEEVEANRKAYDRAFMAQGRNYREEKAPRRGRRLRQIAKTEEEVAAEAPVEVEAESAVEAPAPRQRTARRSLRRRSAAPVESAPSEYDYQEREEYADYAPAPEREYRLEESQPQDTYGEYAKYYRSQGGVSAPGSNLSGDYPGYDSYVGSAYLSHDFYGSNPSLYGVNELYVDGARYGSASPSRRRSSSNRGRDTNSSHSRLGSRRRRNAR